MAPASPTDLDVPAVVVVAGVMVAAAAAKGGYPLWVTGVMISVYVLYLTIRRMNMSRIRPLLARRVRETR